MHKSTVTQSTYTYNELKIADEKCNNTPHERVALKLIDDAILGYFDSDKKDESCADIRVTITVQTFELTDTQHNTDVTINWNYRNELIGHITYRYLFDPTDTTLLTDVTAVSVLNIPGDGCYVSSYMMHYCHYFIKVLTFQPTCYEIPLEDMLPAEAK